MICHLGCGHIDAETGQEMADHVRVLHPEVFTPVETWPDGKPVIYDDTGEQP